MSTRQKHFAFNLLDLVDQLRDLGGAERRRRIENLSLTDTQRAQLEKCLSALPRAEGFLEDPPTLVRNAWSQTRPTPRPMLGSVNEPFGEYRLIEHLASGTFGEVWVAAHRSLDTPGTVPTCLKLLYPDRSDLEDVLREARTMASIRHENVVSVRRADRADVGGQEIAFIEMELVGEAGEGGRFEPAKSLAAGVEDGTPRFTCKETVRIVADVCRGVHAAHVRGTLHRDLKPANILLEMKSRRAKVTDFGIASHFVAEGVVVGPSKGLGTPAYMAPEQARGQATQASDIYAMGAVLYFLLAGHAPYGGTAGNSSSADWQKILDQLRRGEPPAPLPVGKRRLPGPVVAIVRRAMAVDSAARYASAAAMADDLDAFCAGRPTAAARPGAAGRLRLWTRRNPTVALLLLAMLVGAVVGPAVYIRDTRREQRRTESQRAIAVENEKLAIAQRQRAERQVAEGLVLQADALSLAARWLEARSLYREGAAALASMGLATFSADTGAWAVERGTCLPLTEWRSPEWPALATAFSPDCLLFASGGGDKILRLWDPMTGRLVHELPGTGGSIDAIAFSPDGSTVAFGGADGALRLWRINSTEPARVIGTSKKRIRSVAFSPDGRVVACGGDDHFLRTWDLPTGESRLTLAFKRPVTSICFFPDGQRLAITAENLSVVDLRSSTVTHSMPTRGSLAALSRDGTRLLAEGPERGVAVWDTSDWHVVQTLAGNDGAQVAAAAFIGKGSDRALTAGWDKAVRIWDLTTGQQLSMFSPHEGWVLSAALAPDGRQLVTSGFDRVAPMRLWDLQSKSPAIAGEVRDLSADGRCALVSGRDELLHVIDLATREDLAVLPGSRNTYSLTVFRKGMAQVLATGGDWIVREWEVAPARLVSSRHDPMHWVARSPEGRFSLMIEKGELVLREHESRHEAWRTRVGGAWDEAAFSGDGSRIAAWGEATAEIAVIDAATGRPIRTITAEDYHVLGAALSRDGNLLAAASGSDAVGLWDTRSGKRVQSFQTHGSGISNVAIAPDGNWVAGCGEEPTAWFWDTATGREIRAIHTGLRPGTIHVSQDGTRLLISGIPPTYCDFGQPARERELEARAQAARQTLQQSPDQPDALATLGEWYALRYADEWAVTLMERARAGGAKPPSLQLARAYWRLGRPADAAREFRHARAVNAAPADYLELCIAACDRETARHSLR